MGNEGNLNMSIDNIRRLQRIRKQDHLILHEGEVPYLTFEALDAYPWLGHAFSTRLGGATPGERGSMNLSLAALGDGHEDVLENYRRMARSVGFDHEKTVGALQVHGTKIVRVGASDAGSGVIRQNVFTREDGFVTNEPGICLCVYFADCVPLFAVDPKKRAIGSAHSGWRGTVAGIGTKLVEKMAFEFGSSAQDLVCCIGPSICPDCYEVSEDVAEAFENAYSGEVLKKMLFPKGGGKYRLDLHEASFENFVKAGVRPENISVTDICTCCEKDLIFSHRGAKGGPHGLSAGFIFIR